MIKICGNNRKFLRESELNEYHDIINEECLKKFDFTRKLNYDSITDQYRQQLEEQIEKEYTIFIHENF